MKQAGDEWPGSGVAVRTCGLLSLMSALARLHQASEMRVLPPSRVSVGPFGTTLGTHQRRSRHRCDPRVGKRLPKLGDPATMADMNRVAVVTGGSRGIGLGISQALISDGGRTAIADFMLRDYPVLVEFDGLVKYADRGGQTGRANLIAEKGREDWLRGIGFEVERVIWSELDTPIVLARRARRAIDRAKGRSPRAWREALRWAQARG